jgi:putative membrane protein
MEPSTIPGLVADTLANGLPALAVQLGVTGLLHAAGIWLYKRITPYDENALVAAGNVAVGVVLGGSMIALAIPLAATLASHRSAIDILVWGLVALAIQITVFVVVLRRGGAAEAVRQGNLAAALRMVGTMLAFAFINAGAMLG